MTSQSEKYYGDAQRLDKLRDNEEILVIRGEGLYRAQVDLIKKPKNLIEWDVAERVTRILPAFSVNSFTHARRDLVSAPYARCFADNFNKLLQFRSNQSGNVSWATLNGTLPKSGKYWLAFNIYSSNGISLPGTFDMHVGSTPHDVINAPASADMRVRFFTPTKDDIVIGPSGEDKSTIYSGQFNLMLFDMDRGISLAGTGRKTEAGVWSRKIGGRQVHVVASNSVTNVERAFRWQATDATALNGLIPSGYMPLRLDNSSLPDNLVHGDIIVATSSGPFKEMWIAAGDRFQYLKMDDDRVILVLLEAAENVPMFKRTPVSPDIALSSTHSVTANANNLVIARNPVERDNRIQGLVRSGVAKDNIVLTSLMEQVQAVHKSIVVAHTTTDLKQIQRSVVVGERMGKQIDSINDSVVVGSGAGQLMKDITRTVIIGVESSKIKQSQKTLMDSVTVGHHALSNDTAALAFKANSRYVVAVGAKAGWESDGSERSTFVGHLTGAHATNSERTTAIGSQAFLRGYGVDNVAVGTDALRYYGTMRTHSRSQLTALGVNTLTLFTKNLSNASAVGFDAQVSGSNQVQLGNSRANVYSYQPIQLRCDRRDLADIAPTALGLNFILKLKPVQFRYDYREDYIDFTTRPITPQPLRNEPEPPAMPSTDPVYQDALLAYLADREAWLEEKRQWDQTYQNYLDAVTRWERDNDLSRIVKNGSKKRTRLHQGFLPNEVRTAAEESNADFGGYQNHLNQNGLDVETLSPEELLPPMAKSIQDLHALLLERTSFQQFASQSAFIDSVAQRVIELLGHAD